MRSPKHSSGTHSRSGSCPTRWYGAKRCDLFSKAFSRREGPTSWWMSRMTWRPPRSGCRPGRILPLHHRLRDDQRVGATSTVLVPHGVLHAPPGGENPLAKVVRARRDRRPVQRPHVGGFHRDDVVDVLDNAVEEQHLVTVAGGAVLREEIGVKDEVDVTPLILEGEEAEALGGARRLARDHQPRHPDMAVGRSCL